MKVLRMFQRDRPLLIVLTGFYAIFILVSVSKILYFATKEHPFWSKEVFHAFIQVFFGDLLVITLLVIFVLATTDYFLRRNTKWVYVVTFHFFASILTGIFLYLLVFILSVSTGFIEVDHLLAFNHLDRIFGALDINFLNYFTLVSIVYIYHYFKQYREAELEKEETHNRLTAANLNLIKAQLEPHFLFNALNTISSLVHTDKNKATQTIADLGDVLRETLLLRDVQFITVRKELEYLAKYLNILQARFEGQITFSVQATEWCLQQRIPALLLQPLVENAIKHGLKGNVRKIDLLINLNQNEDGELVFSLKNSGHPIETSIPHSYVPSQGLAIVKERLQLIYGPAFAFYVQNIEEEHFNVEAYIAINPKVGAKLPKNQH